jgi:RNA polymerase sigma-70 factor (ECF subfamily)
VLATESEFLQLINKNRGILYKIARMYTDNVADREDLVQEILLHLWKSFAHFEGRSAFSTWMYRVALNTAITFIRKEQKKPVLAGDAEAAWQHLAEDMHTDKDERTALLYKAVQQLNNIEKALIFYYLEGLPHRDIGLQLGITDNNARVKLNRTCTKLQAIINKMTA